MATEEVGADSGLRCVLCLQEFGCGDKDRVR